MLPLEPCDYRCDGCGLITCRELHPSPAEPDTCADCWDTDHEWADRAICGFALGRGNYCYLDDGHEGHHS